MEKRFSVYQLHFGQPYSFYNEQKDSFIWGDATKATLYTKEEAAKKMEELTKLFIDEYQKTGKNYMELHIGDLFYKNILSPQ